MSVEKTLNTCFFENPEKNVKYVFSNTERNVITIKSATGRQILSMKRSLNFVGNSQNTLN